MPRAKRQSAPTGSLTIVGLGPGAWADVTLAAQAALLAAPAIVFRTLRHPTVQALRDQRPDLTVSSFDDLYEAATNWQGLYETMAAQLIDAATTGPVIYAVPGHPLIGETSVRVVRARANERDIPVQIVAGLSFIEPICAVLALDPVADGMQLVDAAELADLLPQQVAGRLTTTRPTLVAQVYNRRMASATKLALLEIYPPTWAVTLVRAAGLPEEQVRAIPLSEMDHDAFADHLTSLYVPAVPEAALQSLRTPEALRYIVARLRAPDGCPWDREQTHASLTPFVLEEAAEVADAIEEFADDPQHLAEELGDLLLQVYLHAEIGQEEAAFSLGDVLEAITSKLIRRHPHVFGAVAVSGAAQVVANWETIKRAERAEAGEAPPFESRLKRSARHTAALAATHDTQRRAVRAGFDWPTFDDWVRKLDEEVQELLAATTPAERADELGDLLFTVVALARRLDVDAELALRDANQKFRRRFQRMEQLAHARGLVFEDLTRAEHVALWNEAKTDMG
jgi:tetrapyrrole methylase family protein/MazG family protein